MDRLLLVDTGPVQELINYVISMQLRWTGLPYYFKDDSRHTLISGPVCLSRSRSTSNPMTNYVISILLYDCRTAFPVMRSRPSVLFIIMSKSVHVCSCCMQSIKINVGNAHINFHCSTVEKICFVEVPMNYQSNLISIM